MTAPIPKNPPTLWHRLLRRLGLRRKNDAEATEVSYRELSIVTLIAALIIGAAFLLAYRFVRPAPPGSFVISTGNEAGAYHLFGGRYRDLLAKEKIRVELRPSSGSLDNLTLLGQLSGKRIAAGPEGSGTRVLVTSVLQAGNALKSGIPLYPLTGMAAAEALIAGRLDAALFVAAPDAPVVQKLLKTPGIRLMSLSHAEALARRFPYLSAVTLPRGMIDLGADIPSSNVRMVAATTHLVARTDFHPALVSVLLQAATKVHGSAGVFRKAGEFPAIREGDFPISEDAQRYFKSGPPFLQRYMPFWLVNLLERMLVLIVPLIAVLIPVMRIMPAFYDWRVKRKIFCWYGELKMVELEVRSKPGAADTARLLARLDEIEDGVDATRVPLTYWDYVYTLRGHIQMVRGRLTNAPAVQAMPLPAPPSR